MADYPSNSYRSKMEGQEDKTRDKREKIISGTARKKSPTFFDVFFTEDLKTIGDNMMSEVIVPKIKETLDDMVHSFLYPNGEKRRSNSAGNTNYTKFSRNGVVIETQKPKTLASSDYQEIELDSRAEAEDVLSCLLDILDDYEVVSVADLYELVGIAPTAANFKYGWDNLHAARIEKTGRGFALRMPRTKLISNS